MADQTNTNTITDADGATYNTINFSELPVSVQKRVKIFENSETWVFVHKNPVALKKNGAMKYALSCKGDLFRHSYRATWKKVIWG